MIIKKKKYLSAFLIFLLFIMIIFVLLALFWKGNSNQGNGDKKESLKVYTDNETVYSEEEIREALNKRLPEGDQKNELSQEEIRTLLDERKEAETKVYSEEELQKALNERK
ncbi:MAG: hypothetical protein IPN70_03840 [Candidatus Moraniibacteriota bacterium]|nr:MAG: hypothetical protein IPN70_03840 [Candidatus Moranbacteria bacterium]